jgi:hypothetical protein
MSLEQLTLSDEQVQDIVASLITSGDNADAVYDDANDTLTVSLSDSISVNTLEAADGAFNESITDPSGTTITGTIKTTQQQLIDRLFAADDFADNKLTNRDDADTTASTLTELANIFRPKWSAVDNSGITIGAANGRLQISVPGDNDAGLAGGYIPLSVSELRTSFGLLDLSNPNDLGLVAGYHTDSDMTTTPRGVGDGILWDDEQDELDVVVNGTSNATAITATDWSSNHDIEIIFSDKDTAEIKRDGTTLATDSTNPVIADYHPFIQGQDLDATSGDIEAEKVEVSQT